MAAPTRVPTKPANPTDAAAATGTAESIRRWDLATDFRPAPDNANPNPDRWGEKTWSFLYSTGAEHDPATYKPLPAYLNPVYPLSLLYPVGRAGVEAWACPPNTADCKTSQGQFTFVGVNSTGIDLVLTGDKDSATWPAHAVALHPEADQMAVVSWKAPSTTRVKVEGRIADDDPHCGNGVAWSIDSTIATLASGSTPDGGTQQFSDGDGGETLRNVDVRAGEILYFTLDAKDHDSLCDTTRLDLTITAL